MQGLKRTITSKTKNYFEHSFIFDLKAGFITSVVALPLAIAFAIASGLDPITGLFTAVIAGILTSSIGGSKFSITGPTGAMTVIILAIVIEHGFVGLIVAGFLAGLIQILFGIMGLGKAVSYIPLPVVSGFTAGIGIIIFLGQIQNALGIPVEYHEFVGTTILEIANKIGLTNFFSLAIALFTIACLIILPKVFSKYKLFKFIPPSIVPLILTTIGTYYFALQVPVIGEIPNSFPDFTFPTITLDLIKDILPGAFTIALLGTIEALLCAVVCDGMSSTKHNPNKELVAQGITNVILPFFGGMPATAAIARSAVNIREGARTRISGVIHGFFLLLYIFVLGPLMANVPKAFLAGILFVISAKMININEFKIISKISRADTLVLFATFILTVFTDLVFAVQIGMVLAIFLIFIRLTHAFEITSSKDHSPSTWINEKINSNQLLSDNVSVYTMEGPFFFGAMNLFDKKITEHMDIKRKIVILRMQSVPFIDSTGIVRLNEFIEDRIYEGKIVLLVGLKHKVREKLFKDAEFKKNVSDDIIFERTHDALEYAENKIKKNLQ